MANCPKCGKELEEGIVKCPTCDVEEKVVENTIEEVQIDPNKVISLDDNKEETKPITEEIETPSTELSTETVETVTTNPETPTVPTEQVTQEEVKEVTTPVVEEVASLPDETNITNDSLEIISVDASNITLEEAPIQSVVIETPEMPEPTIGELNPELLGSVYDEAERINDEKIEAKRQQELAELERKRQEEEARRQAQAQAGRPDLLAGRNNGEINIDTMPKKKKTSKVLIFLLIVLILLAIAGGLYYFFVLKK